MAQTKVKLISDGVIVQGNLHASHGITTAHIGEGSNLYYTDARVGSYLSTNSFATESYVGTQIANLVDSSPGALNTLNELAAALGDDANFSTTVTNSIALKAPLASPSFTGNATFAGSITGGTTIGTAKIIMQGDGTLDWGNVKDYGTLTWDTGYAIIAGQASKGLKLRTNDSTDALTIDTSQNATFAGEVSLKSRLNLQRSSGSATTLIQFKNENGVDRAHIDFGGTNEELSFFAGAGGSEYMRIDSSGRVGIGVTPSYANVPLHTKNLGGGDSYNIFEGIGNAWVFGEVDQAGSKYCQVGGRYGYHSGINIDTVGKVGIGVVVAAEKLEVSGSVKVGNMKFEPSDGGRIGFNRNTSNGVIYDSNYPAFQINGASASTNYLDFQNYSGSGAFLGQFVFSNGKIGIGNTAPSRPLDITSDSGAVALKLRARTNNDYSFMQFFNNAGTTMWSEIYASGTASTVTALHFSVGTTTSEKMRIKSDGHILVATTGQIQFYNTDQYIRASTTNDLEVAAADDINYRSNFSRFFSGSAEHARLTGIGGVSWVVNGSAAHNFGIGTTSPTTKCWVKDSQDSSLFSGLGVERSANTTGVCLNAVGGALNLNTNSSMPIKLRIQNASMQTINPDGGRAYVGFGGWGMFEYSHTFSLTNGATLDLFQNTSAHTDLHMVQIAIRMFHSGRTYFVGSGVVGGYGMNITGSGSGHGNGGLTSATVSSGIRKLQITQSSGYTAQVAVYIQFRLDSASGINVLNGTLSTL